MNNTVHPLTEKLVGSLRYSWMEAAGSECQFSAWLHVSTEVRALSLVLIAICGDYGIDLLGPEYHDITDDLRTLYVLALGRA